MFSLRRVLYKAPSMSRMIAMKRFSTEVSMFRPIATALDVPAREILNNLQATHEMTVRNEERFEEYNRGAIEEYDAMIQNRIDAILGKNAISDWELADDNGFLRKTFTFATPDIAHFFVNEVSRVCSKSDHHPEWRMISDKSIEVYLTSHFAGNKVSINDYELAEAMNKVEKSAKSHNQYSFFKIDKLVEISIVLIVLAFYLKFNKPAYDTVPLKEGSFNKTEFTDVTFEKSVDEQLEEFSFNSIKNHLDE